jgi:hypothetical protein
VSKHPSEANLALFAGGELGRWRQWTVERHVASCTSCRHDVSDFSALRAEALAMRELPDLSWDRLAAEIRANIRLGLEAGECVTRRLVPRGIFSPRVFAACASLALLVVAFLLERPTPRVNELRAPEVAYLESSIAGIQVKEGGHAMMLLNTRAQTDRSGSPDVDYLASGSAMRARYVDADTGYVTINNVYAQ